MIHLFEHNHNKSKNRIWLKMMRNENFLNRYMVSISHNVVSVIPAGYWYFRNMWKFKWRNMWKFKWIFEPQTNFLKIKFRDEFTIIHFSLIYRYIHYSLFNRNNVTDGPSGITCLPNPPTQPPTCPHTLCNNLAFGLIIYNTYYTGLLWCLIILNILKF